MSIHIEAKKGEIAETVLLPGDPLRAKYIAENFFENAKCHNVVRNMLGYTGTYKGHRISVQGTGMGIPSAILYAQELIEDYGAKKLLRVGTIGTIQEDIKLRDIIIAQSATTDSALINKEFFPINYAPISDYDLMEKAVEKAKENKLRVQVGNVFTSDSFYNEDSEKINSKLSKFGILGIDMETAGLYYIAAKYGVKALSIMTVSDQLITDEKSSSKERQTGFNEMIQVALDSAIN